jgi:hypothetical protein
MTAALLPIMMPHAFYGSAVSRRIAFPPSTIKAEFLQKDRQFGARLSKSQMAGCPTLRGFRRLGIPAPDADITQISCYSNLPGKLKSGVELPRFSLPMETVNRWVNGLPGFSQRFLPG